MMRAYCRILAAAAVLCSAMPLAAEPVHQAASTQSSADVALERKVRTALTATLGKPADEIGVSAYNGTVMLYGAVRTRKARSSAEAAASKVLGVHTVFNSLTVVRGS